MYDIVVKLAAVKRLKKNKACSRTQLITRTAKASLNLSEPRRAVEQKKIRILKPQIRRNIEKKRERRV